MSEHIILDEYGNSFTPSPIVVNNSGVIHTDRVHIIGTHDGLCKGEMAIMPISATHAVLACDGRCRFTMHFPRQMQSLNTLARFCLMWNNGAKSKIA